MEGNAGHAFVGYEESDRPAKGNHWSDDQRLAVQIPCQCQAGCRAE
jgi:hypothetical protein